MQYFPLRPCLARLFPFEGIYAHRVHIASERLEVSVGSFLDSCPGGNCKTAALPCRPLPFSGLSLMRRKGWCLKFDVDPCPSASAMIDSAIGLHDFGLCTTIRFSPPSRFVRVRTRSICCRNLRLEGAGKFRHFNFVAAQGAELSKRKFQAEKWNEPIDVQRAVQGLIQKTAPIATVNLAGR
jgi:hypothetical protein